MYLERGRVTQKESHWMMIEVECWGDESERGDVEEALSEINA
jgi:hypothetical protein